MQRQRHATRLGSRRQALAFVMTLTGLAALAGCASSSTVQKAAADAGTSRSFDASYERVRQASLDALTALKLSPTETTETPTGFVLLVSRAPHGMSWGEVGRITVEKSATPPITVRVVYEKRMAFQFAGSESHFARNYFAKLDAALQKAATP